MKLLEILERPPPGARRIDDPESLTPVERSLLVADGTLTDAVEACFLEAMEIVPLGQRRRRAVRTIACLDLTAGSAILDRWIGMRGRHSQAIRFVAHSLIAIDRVPAEFVEDLERADLSLGRILRDRLPAVRREILGAGRVSSPPRGKTLACRADSWLTRRYRLVASGAPIALVTEYLPEARGAPGERRRGALTDARAS